MNNLVKASELAIQNNNLEYNILKLVEETTELNEVLLKILTKDEEFKPSTDKVVEEAADVIIRLHFVLEHMKLTDQVSKYASDKADRLIEWFASGIYGSTLTVKKNRGL